MQQQRGRAEHDDQRPDEDGLAVVLQKIVDRREARKAGPRRLARRRHQLEQGGQQRHRAEVRDDHADAGDEAELRYAAIGGRQE
jgi:hypothetical protein